jgi:hypothetical protein
MDIIKDNRIPIHVKQDYFYSLYLMDKYRNNIEDSNDNYYRCFIIDPQRFMDIYSKKA